VAVTEAEVAGSYWCVAGVREEPSHVSSILVWE
jgi:hypothetical protein